MKRFLVVLLFTLLSGCSVGPFHLTHNYGEPPKFSVDTGIDGCSFRPKVGNIGGGDHDTIAMKCKWKTEFLN